MKKHGKKTAALLLGLVLLCSACSGQKGPAATEGPGTSPEPGSTAAPSGKNGSGQQRTDTAPAGPGTSTAETPPATAAPTSAKPAGPVPAEELPDHDTGCYTMQTFYDSQYGLKTAMALVPYGWQAGLDVEWGVVSTMYPAAATVIMVSPDQDARIEIRSPQAYAQISRNGIAQPEGVSYGSYNIYLNYRNAHDHNLLVASLQGMNGRIESVQGPDETTQAALTEQAYQYLQSFLSGGAATPLGYEGTSEYTVFHSPGNGLYRAGIASAVLGAEFALNAGAYFYQCFWVVPTLATFKTATKEAWDKYEGVFQNVLNNSSFCGEFLYVVRRNGDYMANMISQYLLEQAVSPGAGDIASWDRDYRDDGSDRFVNDWCDVIKEQNEYVTEDGVSLKVSTAYDTVYQDGDMIYMGPDGLSPDGWTRLNQR